MEATVKDQISTEGRVFAAQVSRELKRRERIGASKMVSTLRPKYADRYAKHISVREARWPHGFHLLMRDFGKLSGPKNRIGLLRKASGWFDAIPQEDRGFSMHMRSERKRFSSAPRDATLILITLEPTTHPLAIMVEHGEEGVQAMRHEFRVTPSRDDASIAEVLAYVCSHALGRLCERWTAPVPPTVADGLRFLNFCWKAAETASGRRELAESGINFPFYPDGKDSEPLFAEGCMRVSEDRQAERVCHWFDVRTVLTRDMLEPAQYQQAVALAKLAIGDTDAQVEAVEPRTDFVAKVIAATEK
jgi:hypothetical protein